jgi:hypothetical protein
MPQCDVCHVDVGEIYAFDKLAVCESCFQESRTNELPAFEHHPGMRLEDDQTYTGWWNRDRLPW